MGAGENGSPPRHENKQAGLYVGLRGEELAIVCRKASIGLAGSAGRLVRTVTPCGARQSEYEKLSG